MPEAIRKVNVVGHQHPDTDSICAAISYAYLKSQVDPGTEYEARRAGAINRETAFVLQHFGFQEPRLITDASPQIKDTSYNKTAAIDGETALKKSARNEKVLGKRHLQVVTRRLDAHDARAGALNEGGVIRP